MPFHATLDEPRPTWHSRLVRWRSLGIDLFTSYLATAVRAGAMLMIVGLLSRYTSARWLAAFLFLRFMLGLLNNVFAGATASAIASLKKVPAAELAPLDPDGARAAGQFATPLAYESKSPSIKRAAVQTEGFDGLLLAIAMVAFFASAALVLVVPELAQTALPMLSPTRYSALESFGAMFGIGLIARVLSDAMGGVLQMRRLLWLDNLLVAAGEMAWVAIAWSTFTGNWQHNFLAVGAAYMTSGLGLALARTLIAAALLVDVTRFTLHVRFDVAWRFLLLCGMLAFASLGDFLYAPANNLIVSKFLHPLLIADYGPALQIDAVLLLGVAAIAPVMLPRVVAMHEAGRHAELRQAYLLAMGVGTLILILGAAVTILFRDALLKVWLGEVPPGTRAILPWVLAHTVLGGCNSISRAVMLGLGRFKVFAIGALAGGVLNVSLALVFVLVFGLGLRGVVLATICTVTVRCVFWMPWQVLRILRLEMTRHPPPVS
jgi:O-antigen/teichoic acid export membrane protein